MRKKMNKPTGKVRCYACYAPLPLWDTDDPDTVILKHRVTKDCIFSYPFFPNESKEDIKKFKEVSKKKPFKKKKKYVSKGKQKVAHYKKTGDNK